MFKSHLQGIVGERLTGAGGGRGYGVGAIADEVPGVDTKALVLKAHRVTLPGRVVKVYQETGVATSTTGRTPRPLDARVATLGQGASDEH